MNDTTRLLREHRSIRRFTDEPVLEDHVRAAVEAGQAASTSGAVQAYCVIRVRDVEARERLVALTGDQEKVRDSGAFFVVCADNRRLRLACEREGRDHAARLEGFLVAVIDATLFAQNLCVAFESLGYGICYIGGLRNRLAEVDRLLEVPQDVYPLYGLCVGRPAEDPLPRPRLPVDAVLFEERYPDDDTVRRHLASHDEDVAAYYARRGAPPRRWSELMARKYAAPLRTDLAAYYESKGADLS